MFLMSATYQKHSLVQQVSVNVQQQQHELDIFTRHIYTMGVECPWFVRGQVIQVKCLL